MSNDPSVNELADAIAARVSKLFEKNPPAPPPWMDSAAAGKFLGADEKYMIHLRRCGRGPRYVLVSRKRVRYSLADLRDYMYARYEDPTTRGRKP